MKIALTRLKSSFCLLLTAAVLVVGCALFNTVVKERPKPVPRVVSKFNHATHTEAEIECTECHKGVEEGERAGMPDYESCTDCHDEEDSGPVFAEWLASKPRTDKGVEIKPRRLEGFDDVTVPHDMHGFADVSCSECHGDIGKSDKIVENLSLNKKKCAECHEIKGGENCSKCHGKIRTTTKPSSHDGKWERTHSPVAMTESGEKNERCFLCHASDACGKCHRSKRPGSHDGSWSRAHGSAVNLEFQLQDNKCLFCHSSGDCRKCHMAKEPQSHTASWRNRTHGLQAETERDSCMVCHNQGYCARCHKAAPPRPRDVAHTPAADCGSCHGLLEHGLRGTENFECAKCHK